MSTFTTPERRRFVRNGFIVRDDLIDQELITEAREALIDGIDIDPDDPEQVIGAGYEENAADAVDHDPFEAITEQLFPAVDALVGEGTLADPGGGMQLALQFPDEDATEQFPRPKNAHGHLDGFKNFDSNPEVSSGMVAACVYLNDITPRGGGFTVWPGSHRVAGEFFEDHALETVGGKPNNSQIPAMGESPGEWDYQDTLWNQYDPYEIAGDAGTVVLWHFRLTHTAGIHVGEDIRMSAIKRFSRPDQEEIKREAAANPFAHWPAMEGIDHLPIVD